MSRRQKKSRKKNLTKEKILLATAIISLIERLIELINRLMR